ncbi:MAG: hypothetical protein AB1486_16290 [Planctomycetota bacterium]
MRRTTRSFYALCIASDLAVQRGLLEAASRRIDLRIESRLDDALVRRNWASAIPPVRAFLLELPDTKLATLALLATLRQSNPGVPVLVTTCYDADFQLAADRLATLADRVVFRPFEADSLISSLLDLCQEKTGVS